MKPAKDRPYKKDITYTDAMPKSSIKDYGIPKKTSDKRTAEFDTGIVMGKRPYSCG